MDNINTTNDIEAEQSSKISSKLKEPEHSSLKIEKEKQLITGYEFNNKNELSFIKLLFLIIGCCANVNYPTTTNCMQTIYDIVYDHAAGANTMLIPYLVCTTGFAMLRVYFKNIALWGTTMGVILLFVTNLALALTVQFVTGTAGEVILHIVIGLMGIAVSFLMGNFGAYGIIMPFNFYGLLVAGNAIAGLYAFLLWQFLVRVVYDSSVADDVRAAVWVYYSCNMLAVALLGIIYFYLLKKPWFKGSINLFNESKHIRLYRDADDISNQKTAGTTGLNLAKATEIGLRPLREMIKVPWPFMMLFGLSFFLTYSIFPNVGPYGWDASLDNRSLLIGIYQLIDMIGRYVPNIGKAFLLQIKVAGILIFCRFVFWPVWILMAVTDGSLQSNFPFQLFLHVVFGIFSGYLTVLPALHVAKGLRSVAERGLMGLLSFAAVQLWICIGIITSNIIILIFGITPPDSSKYV